jgi:hypothetical protein
MKVTYEDLVKANRTDLSEKLIRANDLAIVAKICDKYGDYTIISHINSSIHGHAGICMREIKEELKTVKK